MLLTKNTKTKLIPAALGSLALALGFFSSASAQDGEAIFKQSCSACHSTSDKRLVGPGLKGVAERRSEEWILKFVKNPQAVADAGDADAKALIAQFGMPMPPQNLADADIKAVIEFVKSKDESANKTAGATDKPAKVATAADIALGKQLFEGSVAFKNGGPSCLSCHNVNYPDLLEGGRLAKDLTDCYSRMGQEGVAGFIASAGSGPMKEAFKDNPVAEEEIFALTAFFKDAVAKSKVVGEKPTDPLLTGGIIAFIIIICAILLIWFKRKKETVKKEILDRQIEAIN